MNKKIIVAVVLLSFTILVASVLKVSKAKKEEVSPPPTVESLSESFSYLISEYELSVREYASKKGYVRDYSLEYYQGKKENVEIILVGDSILNSGNVLWSDSLAYSLYKLYDGEVSVMNLSVQNSSTEMVINRLQKYLSENTHNDRQFMIILGAGLSDKLDADREVPISGIEESSLAIYNMADLMKKNGTLKNEMISSNELTEIQEKLKISDLDKLVKYLDSIEDEDKKEIVEYLALKKMMKRTLFTTDEAQKFFGQALDFIKKYPIILERDYLVYELISMLDSQKKSDLLVIASVIESHSTMLTRENFQRLKIVLERAQNWNALEEVYNQSMESKLIELKKNHSKKVKNIYAITYPIQYRVNRNILKNGNLGLYSVIDLQDEFKDKNLGVLVSDWSHLTLEGNKEAAKYI